MKIEQTVDYHLRSTLFAMRRMYNLLAAKNGITQGIGYVLVNIGKDGVPATKIAPLMGMTSSSLSRLLKNMEDDGLIYREAGKTDKRVVKIFLTAKGLDLKKKIRKVVFDFNRRLFESISEEDFEAFVRVSNAVKEQVWQVTGEFQENNGVLTN